MSRGGGGSSKATPGRSYVANADGDLEDVGESAYGTSGGTGKTSELLKLLGANPGKKSTKVRRGEKLIIPGEQPPIKLTGRSDDEMVFVVDGIEIPMQSARIIRTMDTAADGWVARFAWTPGRDERMDKATRPYGYPRAAAYIGNQLLVGGCLYEVSPEMTDRGLIKELTGYSFTADAIDSHTRPPYEFNNVTLKQLADRFCAPLGINAVFECPVGAKFDRVTAHESDTIFTFLAKLAGQRGMLVSSTPHGDMLFLRARIDGKTVGTLEESQPMVTGWKAKYDGRKRFHAYTCITSGAKQGATVSVTAAGITKGGRTGPSTVTELDHAVPRSRFLTFRADDTTTGNIKDAARWRKNRQFIEALTLPYPVSGWYAPDGTLWRENTLVTVVSRTIGVPQGYTFLIRSVEYILEDDKRHATLHLVPPQAYSGKDVGDIWK